MVAWNLVVGWVSILLGFCSGAGMGLFFREENWLGGYTSWPRRMLRLGHISFFGMAFVNLAFVFTVPYLAPSAILSWASGLLVVAAVGMPLVCLLSAFRGRLRHLFVVPVGSLLTAAALIVFACIAAVRALAYP